MKLFLLTAMSALFVVNGSYAVSEDSSEVNFGSNEFDTNGDCRYGECNVDLECHGWACRDGCCVGATTTTTTSAKSTKDLFISQLSKQEDFDFVYVGKSEKSGGSKHECRNSNDCRSSETCVYNRSKGYRVCRKPSTGKSCQRSNECKNNERCNDAGYCIRDNKNRKPTSGDRCTKRSDCGPHRSCGSNGRCQRRGAMEEE